MPTESKTMYQHQKVYNSTPLRYWTFQSVIALILFSVSSFVGLHAKEVKPQSESIALLDQIWPYKWPHKRPLNKQDQEYAQAALVQWLEAYLHREYEVVDARYFWTRRKDQAFGQVANGLALYPENENGRWRVIEEIKQPWHDPGFDLVRIWKVNIDGNDHYFALAMTNYPVPGTRGSNLMAYFQLKKVAE
jgi:hypothetical protein